MRRVSPTFSRNLDNVRVHLNMFLDEFTKFVCVIMMVVLASLLGKTDESELVT